MPERTAPVKSEDGTFDIDQVASGSYEIIAIEFSGDAPRMIHRPIEVGGADVDGADWHSNQALTSPVIFDGKTKLPRQTFRYRFRWSRTSRLQHASHAQVNLTDPSS